jgi:endonuclease-3
MPRRGKPSIPELVEALEGLYGRPTWSMRFEPVEELVSCILSQHTSDATSFPAFARLRRTFPVWQDVVDAGPERVAETVRKAGLANQKAKAIVACLRRIRELNGDYTLEPLRAMPTAEARAWLEALPGVGPKTAAIVLCFGFGRESIPVDTHVFRVSRRLGLLSPKADANKAHDELLSLVPPEWAFRFHVALIQHGRQVCRAPLPDCAHCPLSGRCPYFAAGGPERRRAQAAHGSPARGSGAG